MRQEKGRATRPVKVDEAPSSQGDEVFGGTAEETPKERGSWDMVAAGRDPWYGLKLARCGMDKRTAEQLAVLVGGEAWQSGGGIYLVTVNREDGSLVVFSGDAICEYENDEAFDAGRASATILLNIPETEDLYVIVDLEGNVFYEDNAMERGWRHEEDAHHEARALESRGEGKFSVVRQSELPA